MKHTKTNSTHAKFMCNTKLLIRCLFPFHFLSLLCLWFYFYDSINGFKYCLINLVNLNAERFLFIFETSFLGKTDVFPTIVFMDLTEIMRTPEGPRSNSLSPKFFRYLRSGHLRWSITNVKLYIYYSNSTGEKDCHERPHRA